MNSANGKTTNGMAFSEAVKKYFPTLKQYIPIVARVHGGNHPEFHEVRNLFDSISEKTKKAGIKKPVLNEEFTRLREITNNYKIPDDVCESYEAVYRMLSEIDKAYNS